jgi:hypothetical protein
MRSRIINHSITIIIVILLIGCASINVSEQTKNRFRYEEKVDSIPTTSCYADKKAGSTWCTTTYSDIKTIITEVSLGIAKGTNDCVITVHGQIDKDVRDAFIEATDEIKKLKCDRKIVLLSSSGGLVTEAIEIGIAIRKNKFITLFDGQKGGNTRCASSCTLLFIAGVERIATENSIPLFSGKMGFHQWQRNSSLGGMCTDLPYMKNRLTRYAQVMLSKESAEKFVEMTIETECREVRNFTASDLLKLGISTSKSL